MGQMGPIRGALKDHAEDEPWWARKVTGPQRKPGDLGDAQWGAAGVGGWSPSSTELLLRPE